MYQLPELAKNKGLVHRFSTKHDGNQRYGLMPWESVTQNRARFLQKVCPRTPRGFFGMTVEMRNMLRGYEEEIRIVRTKWDAGKGMLGTPSIPCEAMVTDSPGLFLFVTVGDCIPFILFDPRRRVLALVHAGRESTVRRIPEKTLAVMRKQFHTDPADVIVGMGPGFRSHSLKELPASIGNDALWRMHCHLEGREFAVNLFSYNRDRLMSAGVPEEQIEECELDTYKRSDLFFSHRLFSEIGGMNGRHACVVGMVG